MAENVDGNKIRVSELAKCLSYEPATMAKILGVSPNAVLKTAEVAAFLQNPERGAKEAEKFIRALQKDEDIAISTAALAKNLRITHAHTLRKYTSDLVIPQGPERKTYAWSFSRYKELWENLPKFTDVSDED